MQKSLVLITFIILASCYKVPITNRSQFKLLPESMLSNAGATQYQALKSKSPIASRNNQLVNSVYTVGEKMSRAVDQFLRQKGYSSRLSTIRWEFTVIDNPSVNAFVLPGGKVAFYNGILPICRDEAGIAAVMGHEIAHAIARHGNERVSQQLAIATGVSSLNLALQNKPTETRNLIMAAAGAGTMVGISLPFSRKHETEADEIGLIFMALAGYDPRVAVDFWQRMAQQGGGRVPEFLSTHPGHQTRAKNLQKFMPKALKYYRP